MGKQLAALAGQHMKRVTMELGGHAPVIVAEDADIDLAVKAAGAAKFRNAGQVCISPTRFLVHNSVKEEFAQALVKPRRSSLKVGDGPAQGAQMGPLANPRRLAAMAEFQQDAVEKGATLLTGGSRIGETGNFFAPTVLTDVPLEARPVQRRALRPDRGGPRLRPAGGGDHRGKPPALRPGRLCLHPLAGPCRSADPPGRSRHAVGEHARDALG